MTRGLKVQPRANVTAIHDHYRDAGVDTDEAEEGLQRLTSRIVQTWPSKGEPNAVKLEIGYFANVVEICGQGIAISTDGIGSKAMIATMLGKYDTVGIDCVAMNVNDLICVGAKPVSMVDYIAIEKTSADILDAISIGLCEGAKLAKISISGGEIAQLKDMVRGFDLAGTAIGHVPLSRIIVGQDIQDGDVVIGIESSGIHSNGLSLARRAFFERNNYSVAYRFQDLDSDIGTELLKPTHIYVREILELIDRIRSVKALIHITSDGFLNMTRVKADVGYVIDNLPQIPPIFRIIQHLDDVGDEQMFSVFNMGIGFCAVVADSDAESALSILSAAGKRAHRIGHASSKLKKQVLLPQYGLVGQGKHFQTT
jgi:phosphoribosylformylglycinamidine cyclo-ligase